MKITIVLNGFYRPPSLMCQVDRLKLAIEKYAECEVVDTTEILAYVKNDTSLIEQVKSIPSIANTEYNDYIVNTDNAIASRLQTDAVLYLDKDIHIAAMLEKCGLKLFNSARSIAVTDDKMLTHIALANANIKMPVTISAPLKYRGEDDGKFINNLLNILRFPIIVKECHGSFGSQVYFAAEREELAGLRKMLSCKPHIYQEYIESSKGRDVRIIVIGDKVAAAMERCNYKNFKSNIEQGGEGKALNIDDLDECFVNTAIKAAKILGLDYAGVDLLYGACGEPILCEVNSNAYFNKISEVTGVDIPEIYIKHIVKKLQCK